MKIKDILLRVFWVVGYVPEAIVWFVLCALLRVRDDGGDRTVPVHCGDCWQDDSDQ